MFTRSVDCIPPATARPPEHTEKLIYFRFLRTERKKRRYSRNKYLAKYYSLSTNTGRGFLCRLRATTEIENIEWFSPIIPTNFLTTHIRLVCQPFDRYLNFFGPNAHLIYSHSDIAYSVTVDIEFKNNDYLH